MPSGGPRPVRTNSQAKPVSGPGALSQRTDMQPAPPGTAPIQQVGGTPQNFKIPSTPVTSLFDPTQRPNEPVTAGVPVGPGYSPVQVNSKYAMVNKYMDQLETMAAQPDAPEAFKTFLTYVKNESQKG